MRIHFVLDETSFFQPGFLRDVLKGLRKEDTVVGISIILIPIKNSLLHQCLIRNIFAVGLGSIFSLGLLAVGHGLANIGFRLGFPVRARSVLEIARKAGLPFQVTKQIMSAESLEWIASRKPDVILASCSQIFKKSLLDLPRITCINRHSGLLPAYGGVFPVLQALLHGEKEIGSTIHLMTEKIDGGALVAQSTIPVIPGDTVYSLYERSYEECASLALQAFDKLRSIPDKSALGDQNFGVPVRAKKSYFRSPTKEEWRRYRLLGIRFCRLRSLFTNPAVSLSPN